MPIHAATLPGGGKGFQWGSRGKIYRSRKGAERQAAAAHAHGFQGDIDPDELESAIAEALEEQRQLHPAFGRDMSEQDWQGLTHFLLKFLTEERSEPEHAEDAAKAAGLALVLPDGQGLFLRRSGNSDHTGEWAWPGGMIEAGEKPDEAAVRETREETGWIAPDNVDKPRQRTMHDDFVTFRQNINSPFIPTLNGEHDGWAWAPLKAPPQPLHPGVEATLEKIAEDVEFKEEQHPRGGKGTEKGGQFVSKGEGGGGGRLPETHRKEQVQPAKQEHGTFIREGKGVSHKGDLTYKNSKDEGKQSAKDLDHLYEMAHKHEPYFQHELKTLSGARNMALSFGREHEGSNLKTRESSERKLRDEMGGDHTVLRDVMRATMIGDTVEDTRKAAAEIINHLGDRVVRIKDRYNKPAGGYRDILINYRAPGGLVAELQLNSKSMVKTKQGEGHKLYEELRQNLTDPRLIVILRNRSKQVYDKAYHADGDGKW